MNLWSNWGATPRPSLDGLATALGLQGKSGQGSQVASWWAEGDLDSIAAYCRDDIRLTYQVFLRLTYQKLPDRFAASELIAEENRNHEVIVHSRD